MKQIALSAAIILCQVTLGSAQFAPTWSEGDLKRIESFPSGERLVGTYYFYWYEYPDEHFFDDAAHTDDALQDHFPDPESVSYNSSAWHEREMADVAECGIDFILPIYWGTLDNYFAKGTWFSVRGLGPLQWAIEQRQRRGEPAPKIGMFYDTSTLLPSVRRAIGESGKPDLTTPKGKDLFYRTIRDFFAQIKPEHWAAIDGRPIVVLYSSAFAAAHDQSTIDYVYGHFMQDFYGIRPYIIREISWHVRTDSAYAWGAALNGPNFHGVACVGPGYNDSAVPGRKTPIRDREEGNFYTWGWSKVLASDARIALIETWNEMHEGTEICRTKEYGDQYIRLTRKFVDLFKRGETLQETVQLRYPDPLPRPRLDIGGEYAGANSVEISFGQGIDQKGINLVRGVADGPFSMGERGGRRCLLSGSGDISYIYFSVVDPFSFEEKSPVEVEVVYFDEGFSRFVLQYDSHDKTAVLSGAYKDTTAVSSRDSATWRTRTFRLRDARFVNRQNGGADFRLAVIQGQLAVWKVTVQKTSSVGQE